jgi:hypothetical protein
MTTNNMPRYFLIGARFNGIEWSCQVLAIARRTHLLFRITTNGVLILPSIGRISEIVDQQGLGKKAMSIKALETGALPRNDSEASGG